MHMRRLKTGIFLTLAPWPAVYDRRREEEKERIYSYRDLNRSQVQ